MRNNYQNPFAEDMDEFGKVGAELSYIQSQMYSDYDSAESIADSDLEDGELKKSWLHQHYMQGRGDHKSSRIPIGETCCNVFIREQGTGKPTQEFYFQTR